MIETRDIHWLAGWLEGEASFSIYNRDNKWVEIVIKATSTDHDVVSRAATMLDSRMSVRKPQQPHHKKAWDIKISGQRAASWMMTLYSLMGERRKERIRSILLQWTALPPVMSLTERQRRGQFSWKHGREALLRIYGPGVQRAEENLYIQGEVKESKCQ